jgi:hypothetical protein
MHPCEMKVMAAAENTGIKNSKYRKRRQVNVREDILRKMSQCLMLEYCV